MEIKTWSELNGTDPKSSHCVLRIVKNFKSKQCIMSRVVTNRGRQRFRVAVNGESLSDDLKKKQPWSEPKNPWKKQPGKGPKNPWSKSTANSRQKSSANSRQRRESVMAVRRLEFGTKLQSDETQCWWRMRWQAHEKKCWCDQFAKEKQQKLEEKAVVDWEWSRESRRWSNGAAGSTNKLHMVETCHKRISNIKQTSSQRTWPRINRRRGQSTLVGWHQVSSSNQTSPHVRVSTACLVYNPCSRAKVVNMSRPRSTIEVENVHGSQSVSVVL